MAGSARPAKDYEAATERLAADIVAGDRRALAKGITLVESTRADHRAQADALLAALPNVRASLGLRLHWNMLCLAHGIPAALLGTDTRTESFCDLLGLPFHALADTSAEALLRSLDAFDPTRFVRRWQILQGCMQRVLAQNGLVSAWQQQPEVAR